MVGPVPGRRRDADGACPKGAAPATESSVEASGTTCELSLPDRCGSKCYKPGAHLGCGPYGALRCLLPSDVVGPEDQLAPRLAGHMAVARGLVVVGGGGWFQPPSQEPSPCPPCPLSQPLFCNQSANPVNIWDPGEPPSLTHFYVFQKRAPGRGGGQPLDARPGEGHAA